MAGKLPAAGGYCLAGGKSSRMGADKALLELGGETLVARAVGKLCAVCAEVAIAGGDERLKGFGRVVRDQRAGCGPLGGIVAGLEDSGLEWNLFLAVDVPFVPVEVLERLLGLAGEDCVGVVAEVGGVVQPLCAAYSRRGLGVLRGELEAGRWRVKTAVEAAGAVKYLQLSEAGWFSNINTPEEFAAAERRLTVLES